jgi:hypothetical protein
MSALRGGRFRLYCYILKKYRRSVHVDVAGDLTVSDLREELLNLSKSENTLVGVDAQQLKIWKVRTFQLSNLNPVLKADKHYMSTQDLKTQLANLQLLDKDALDGAILLSSEFSDALLGQIHVFAEAPDGESLFYPSSSRSLLHTPTPVILPPVDSHLVVDCDSYLLACWPAPLMIVRFLTLQITALRRNLAWAVGFLIMKMPCSIFFGTRFGEIQLLNALSKSLLIFLIQGRWKRQLRKRTTSVSDSRMRTTPSRVV